jgi:hypothetical protein
VRKDDHEGKYQSHHNYIKRLVPAQHLAAVKREYRQHVEECKKYADKYRELYRIVKICWVAGVAKPKKNARRLRICKDDKICKRALQQILFRSAFQ